MKQAIRWTGLVAVSFLICISFILCGCWILLKNIPSDEVDKVLEFTLGDNTAAEEMDNTPLYNFECDKHYSYAYDYLSEEERQWYHDINSIIAHMQIDKPLSLSGLEQGLTVENIDKIFQCVLLDHPEYFYVEGYNYQIYTVFDKCVKIGFSGKYTMEQSEAVARAEEIVAATKEILAEAPFNGSDYEKIVYVYDKVITQTEYNQAATDNQNIYSVLVGKESVCQGYAKTVQYLLNQLDVDCTLVLGQVTGGEGHAWNLVKSGGEFYYVDATGGEVSYRLVGGDDNVIKGPDINYDYLCVTTEVMNKTHTVSSVVPMPECTATADNYYVRNGCMFKAYDSNQIQRLIEEAVEQGKGYVTFKCINHNVYDIMKKKLIDEKEFFSYLGKSITSLSFAENEEQLTLTFWVTN